MTTERDLWVLEQVLLRGLVSQEEAARLVAAMREGRFLNLAQALQALKPWTPEQEPILQEALRAVPGTSTDAGPTPIVGATPTPLTVSTPSLRHTPPPPPATSGNLAFGRYEILEEIARGGMGVVYKGRDVKLDRIVALKVLVGAATPDMVERFRREARMVAGLHHERILPVHDVGDQDGLCYFTMDFVEGGSLATLIREKQVSRRQGVDMIRDVARALHYAHENGVIHRDVKPGNILVDKMGRAYLADFGVARATATEARLTASGHPLGTPQYMSPEQGAGETGRLDGRTDVYSLGASLYELLTGRPPYEGESVMDIVFQLMTNDPIPPTAVDPKIPRDLEVITLKALERDLGRRYATAGALADDLTRFLEGEAIEARPSGVFRRSWKRVRKHPVRATVVAAAVVGAVAWTGLLWWQGVRDRRRSLDLLDQARADVASGRLEDAIRFLGSALSLDPANRAAQVLDETCRADIRAREEREKEEARVAEIERRNERRRRAQPSAEGAERILDVIDALARHGELAKRREKLTQAEDLLEKALAEDPDYAEALYARGRVRRQLGRTADAIADLEKAVSLRDTYSAPYVELIGLRADLYKALRHPSAEIGRPGGPVLWHFRDVTKRGDAQALLACMRQDLARVLAIGVRPEEAHYLKGTLAAVDDRPDEAIRELNEALSLHPYYAEAFWKRSFAFLVRGDTDAALADVEKALDLSPAFAEAWCYRAMIRLARGDAEGAEHDFAHARDIDPDLAQAHAGLGLLYTTLSRWSDALTQFNRLVDLDPEANSFFNRGTVYLNLRQLDKAKADLDHAIQLDPGELGPYVHRAQAYIAMGDLPAAEKDIERASEIDADNPVVRFTLSSLKKERGDLDGAVAECDKALAKSPDNAVLWFARAGYKGEKGDTKGQLADLDEGLKRAPDDLRARSDRAPLRAAAGDLAGAKEDLDRVLAKTPGDAKARCWRGRVLAAMNDAAAGLPDLDAAVAAEPLVPAYRYYRGVLRAEAGKMQEGAEDLEAFLRVLPNDPESQGVRSLLAHVKYFAAHMDLYADVSKGAKALAEASRRAEAAYGVEDWKKAIDEYRAGLDAFDRCVDGRDAELRQQVEKGPSTGPLLINVWYNLACCLARRAGQAEGAEREALLADALHALGESLRLGFGDLDHVRSDPDLALLRGRKEFDSLLGKPR